MFLKENILKILEIFYRNRLEKVKMKALLKTFMQLAGHLISTNLQILWESL